MKRLNAPADFTLDAIRVAMLANDARALALSTMKTETSTAAGLVIHYHDLGMTPQTLYALPWDDARVWATADDRKQWNAQQVVFHMSANSTRVDVAVGLR